MNELMNSQKEERSRIYQIEKEDIMLMEKSKFFQEREREMSMHHHKKKSLGGEISRQKLEEEIKDLIQDINTAIGDRNRTEQDKKLKIKALTSEISSLEAKNWELCNKLREIDNTLLNYYDKKSRKK